MADATTELLKVQLKQLRLPAMVQELEKLSREAASANQTYEQFLLQLTAIELAAPPPIPWRLGSSRPNSRS